MAGLILRHPQALLALPFLGLLLVALAWRRRLKPWGAFLLRLTVAVLVTLALTRPVLLASVATQASRDAGRLVLLVDQSASLGETGQRALRTVAARLAQTSPDSLVLYYADQAIMMDSPLSPPAALPLNPERSNLATALSLGSRLLEGQPGRLILLSDGLATEGDTTQATAELIRQGIPVDVVIPERRETQNEVRLTNLHAPSLLRQGETFELALTVHSTRATEVTLNLIQDDTLLAQESIALEPGSNAFTFEASVDEVGPHTFRAAVTAADGEDVQPVNNALSAFTQVYPPPQVLVVGDDVLPRAVFARQLLEAGFAPQMIRPVELPSRLSSLEPYAGMVLLNVSARALGLEQMVAVQEFVRSLGRGLLVTGGRDSFSLGNYEDTPLAELLPVSLEPPPREERPPVALLLLIDHSGSMSVGNETLKLTMAKEAAIRATEIMGPKDWIGVLIFDSDYQWIVPFQQTQDGAALLEIQSQIASIPPGGGTRILTALAAGLPALAEQNATSGARHAVLLTDGKSFDGPQGIEDYDVVVDAALEVDITLSTIAIGEGADEELLTHLAERGQGRYHFAKAPEELPALTIAESAILRSDALQEGEFRPTVFMPHPLLRGLFPANGTSGALPALRGYIALTPKPQAETALQIGPGDPLLSVWGYGLGRVAAWTSDTWDEWASDWLTWSESNRFWGQVMGYTLPTPDLGLLQLATEITPDGVVTLSAEGLTATGQTADLARTQATLTTPAGKTIQLNLLQVAPGHYQQRVRLPDPGAYQFSVTQTRTDGTDETAATGFVIPYPAEYAVQESGAGEALLRQIAAATGGQVLALSESSSPGVDPNSTTDSASEPLELWPWLSLAALILWPIEIAWRRRTRLRIQ